MTDVLEESLRRHADKMKEDNVGRQQIRDFVSLAKRWIDRAAKHQISTELSKERFFRLLKQVEEMETVQVLEQSNRRAAANAASYVTSSS